MPSLHIAPTQLAQWHSLILDAESMAKCHVNENVESYLIITLDHFLHETKFLSRAIALDFLEALEINKIQRASQMRNVGDQCLILTGLFPEQARKRNVSIEYYIGMGRHAYHAIGEDVFLELSMHFKELISILQAVRVLPLQRLLLRSD